MTPNEFKEYLNTLPYDKFCQDIEYIKLIGHSKSYATWNLMKDMFDWKDKNVVDLGGFHGYYAFKIEQECASHVAVFDRSSQVLRTTNMLREAYNSSICVCEWNLGQPVNKGYDIAILLSVLYFAEDRELAIKNIGCKYLLCDVGDEDVALIAKYYDIIEHKESWGIGERNGIGNLMLCKRKNYE